MLRSLGESSHQQSTGTAKGANAVRSLCLTSNISTSCNTGTLEVRLASPAVCFSLSQFIVLLTPITRLEATEAYFVRPIEGIGYSQHDRNRFSTTRGLAASGFFNIYANEAAYPAERVRLSLTSVMRVQEMTPADLPDECELMHSRGELHILPIRSEPAYRLDRHLFLCSLFATSRPIKEVGVDSLDISPDALDILRRRPRAENVNNEDGVTVLDLVDAGTRWRVEPAMETWTVLPFVGVRWDSEDGTVSSHGLRSRATYPLTTCYPQAVFLYQQCL